MIIDLSYNIYSPGLYARKVWQELFKTYRKYGDLDNMDSFLCDYDILKKDFEKNKSFRLYWQCDRGWTEILDFVGLGPSTEIIYNYENQTVEIK